MTLKEKINPKTWDNTYYYRMDKSIHYTTRGQRIVVVKSN